MKKYIAVDLGASNGRVVVGDLEKIEVTNRFVTRNEKIGNSVHWDILYIFSEIKKGLKKAFSLYPEPGTISGIGIDSWGVDFGLLDKNDMLIGMPYHYRDSRTDGMMEEVFCEVSQEEIYKTTGIQFMQLNTIFQLASMRKEHPELLNAAETYLSIPDLLSFWLSGVKANEYSHASTTQLLDPITGDWAWELIEKLGLPRTIFGNIVRSGTVLGPLRSDIADEVGAPKGESVQVIASGGHDTASAVAAVPSAGDDTGLYISSGTWSLLGTVTEKPIINADSMRNNFTNEGAAPKGTRFLKNIMGMWIQQECIRWWESQGESISFKDLDDETLKSADFTGTIDPGDNRFLKPNSEGVSMPDRIKEYCREHVLPEPQSKGEFMTAIYRGLAKAYALYVDQISDLTDTNFEQIFIIGGGCKNVILNQWTADETGKTVSAGPVEATALGNILLQALAMGDIASLKEGREYIRTHHEYTVFEPLS